MFYKRKSIPANRNTQPVEKPLHSAKKECGEAADAFFASFLGTKKEVGNGGKAPNTPTWKPKTKNKKAARSDFFDSLSIPANRNTSVCQKISAFYEENGDFKLSGEAADSFFASFLGSKKEVGSGATSRIHRRRVQILRCFYQC